ncbi:hypothetical protein EPI10_016050 [Gossypium australe]|uniref:Uncharacterized protein n=1 Tax=Gossypium australe TaxID=47621 RepID=A0A5B6VMQ1_9ROSI|nr:hypothetical protein EPI10_016050 [Gossypium australe]
MDSPLGPNEPIDNDVSKSFPSNTGNNPRRYGKEHRKVIALQSTKALKLPNTPIHEEDEVPEEVDEPMEEKEAENHELIKEIVESMHDLVTLISSTMKVLDKQKRDQTDFLSVLNLFKSLNVNLPLLELIDKILKYA